VQNKYDPKPGTLLVADQDIELEESSYDEIWNGPYAYAMLNRWCSFSPGTVFMYLGWTRCVEVIQHKFLQGQKLYFLSEPATGRRPPGILRFTLLRPAIKDNNKQ